MHITYLLPLLSLVAAAVVDPRNDANTSPRHGLGTIEVLSGEIQSDSERRNLQARGCEYNGCKCRKGVKPGIYCGSCTDGSWIVTKKRIEMHAFQCAEDGDCCTYGPRSDCNEWGGKCPE